MFSKADVYSFGIVLWELLTMEKPYSDMRGWDVPGLVMKGDRPPVPSTDEWDDWIIKLMKTCWHQRPTKRPTFSEIVEVLTKQKENERKPRSIDHFSSSNSLSVRGDTKRSRSKSPSMRRHSTKRMQASGISLTDPCPEKQDSETESDNSSDPNLSVSQRNLSGITRKKKSKKKRVSGYSSDSPVLFRSRHDTDSPPVITISPH